MGLVVGTRTDARHFHPASEARAEIECQIPIAAQPAVAVGPALLSAFPGSGSLADTKAFRGRVQGAAGL